MLNFRKKNPERLKSHYSLKFLISLNVYVIKVNKRQRKCKKTIPLNVTKKN